MNSVFEILLIVLQVYGYVLLARAILSWIPNLDPSNPIVQVLYQVTEPVLEPIRRLIPPLGGMMDISIIVAFFAIMILQQLLQSLAAS